MALSEFEIEKAKILIEGFMEKRRPPVEIRDEVDLGCRIHGQSIIIFEVRSDWRDSNQKIEEMVAKTTYVMTDRRWKIFWMRSDLKWHRYDPLPEVDDLEDFFTTIDQDDHACFWG